MVPGHNQSYLPFYDEISQRSGGKTYLVTQDTPVRKYWSLVTAFHDICDASIGSVTVYSDIHDITRNQSQSTGSFVVDSSLGRDTVFGIIVEDEEDHLIDNVVFENELGEVYGPYSHIATTFDTINLKTISFGLTRHQPFGDTQHVGHVWKYTVRWHVPEVPREAVVMVTSRPVSEEIRGDFDVSMWTSAMSNHVNVTHEHPLIIYASVTKDGAPVIDASVHVSVEIITATQKFNIAPFELKDTGNGDPDLMSGDGVYSRMLVEYPAVGRYVFTVHVSSLKNQTRVISQVNASEVSHVPWLRTCCGSSVITEDSQLLDIEQVRRVTHGSAVTVTSIPDHDTLNKITPSRIADLDIKLVMESQSLLASWTAPGDNNDHGAVSRYLFVFSSSISHLLGGHVMHVSEVSPDVTTLALVRQDNAGTGVRHELQFESSLGQHFYVGLIGIDNANNSGKISNLVKLKLPPQVISLRDESDPEMQVENNDSQTMVILGVCVSLLLLAIFLIIAVLYFVKCRNRKFPRHVPNSSGHVATCRDDLTDNTSCSSDARNNSGNNLMPDLGSHIRTISGARPSPGPYLFTAPPPSLPDSTPTYWSATKLLTEHEQRALAMSYAPLTGGHLSSIHEEYIGYPEEYPDDDSLTYSITSRERSIRDAGISNPSFRHSSGATLLQPPHLALEEESDSGSHVSQVVDTYPRGLSPETPVRFSTAVQTIAPSTIARLRQNNTYLASLKTRNVSLV